jgi:hypothetical protein
MPTPNIPASTTISTTLGLVEGARRALLAGDTAFTQRYLDDAIIRLRRATADQDEVLRDWARTRERPASPVVGLEGWNRLQQQRATRRSLDLGAG